MHKLILISALMLTAPLQGLGSEVFESGLIFHHEDDCALETKTCDTDSEGNGGCIAWVAPYAPSAFRVHASAAADGSKYWIFFGFGVDDGRANLNYNYKVPYNTWREVRLDEEYSACQLYAHFPVIHQVMDTHAVAGAATDYNYGEYYTEASVESLRLSGTELVEQKRLNLAEAYCRLPSGCLPGSTGDCSRYCSPEDETDLQIVQFWVTADNLWGLPASNSFTLEDIDGLQVEYSTSPESTAGACEALPLLEIDLNLNATSRGWPGEAGVDGGEALACFGAYGNLTDFNYAKCPGWDGGPNHTAPPGSGIRIIGRASQAGVDTNEGGLVVSVPVRQLWSEENMSGWEIVDPDTDCDGVIDDDDRCPMTPPSSLVNEFGCTASQYIDLMCGMVDCQQDHGPYVSCVADTVREVVDQGLISKNEKGRFIRTAARCK